MRRYLWINLVLAVVLIGAAAVIWLHPGRSNKHRHLTDLHTDRITHIVFRHRGQATVELQRDGDRWMMQKPYPMPANPVQVRKLLHLTNEQILGSYSLEQVDRKKVGLDPPLATVDYAGTRLAFGAANLVTHDRLAQLDKQVYRIADLGDSVLEASPASFVSLKLLPDNTMFKAIILPNLQLDLDAANGWQAKPAPAKLKADTMQALVDNWREAQALWVRAAKPPTVNRGRITLKLKNGKTVRFIIVQHRPNLILFRQGVNLSYLMPPDATTKLLQLQSGSGKAATQ
jgi:hypothetical protein